MKDVEILMLSPAMPLIMEGISERFTVHRLWEKPNAETYLHEVAAGIRGLSPGGHAKVDGQVFDKLPNLEIVSNMGVGYDTIDAKEAGRRGIVVTNTPDVLTDEVADLTLGLLLATVRHLPQADRHVRSGGWLKNPYPLTATLRGRTIGILGLGRIGQAVAKRLEGFSVEIAYHTRTKKAGIPYRYEPTLLGLAESCDVLICIAPGGPETNGMVGAEVLKALGPTGILINVGRGSVVDEPALIQALKDKTILSAGLDVFADEPRVPAELIAMDGIVLLPHVGSASVETRRAMGQLVVDNLVSWFSGKGPITPVPETPFRGSALA